MPIVCLIVLVLALAAALPGLASGGEVTRGDFHTFADGIDRGYDIAGRAQMIRTGSGKTIVKTNASGLAANTTYGVHVHNKACNDSNGGGHYQNAPGGPVDSYNEIWPGFTTNSAGIGNGKAKHAFYARPEAQSVVIHDTDGKRIACADLE
jgi:Cu/Zn superoxide dismutase